VVFSLEDFLPNSYKQGPFPIYLCLPHLLSCLVKNTNYPTARSALFFSVLLRNFSLLGGHTCCPQYRVLNHSQLMFLSFI
jgi:hypothetical protein